MGSDSDMPVMKKAAEVLEQLGVEFEMTIISAHREPDVFFEYAKSAESKGFKVIIAGAGMAAHLPGMCAAIFPMPVIGIPMHTTSLGGRDSLYSIVQMPSGIPVAGMAAHLPGMCAAIFPMPVIGIPMHTTSLGGRDSLYSIVQMPSGIPVATVAINGGANAGLLAAKILATSDPELLARLKAYAEDLKEQVEKKAERLAEVGYKNY